MIFGKKNYLLVGWQGLESVDRHLATGESTKGLSRIFELNTWKFRLLWMKTTEFVHIHRKI